MSMSRNRVLNRSEVGGLILYQICSKAVFLAVLAVYKLLCGMILWNMGRPAFTSGDLPFILRSWQGWLLVLLGFVLLVIYTCFDINATVLISKRLLYEEKVSVIAVLKESAKKTRHFFSFRGVLIVLYVSIVAPLTGLTLGITLTQNVTIPEFIMSVINSVFIFRVGFIAVIIGLIVLGIVYFFSFHYILLDDMKAKDALSQAAKLMKSNLKTFLKEILIFILKSILIFVAIVAVAYVIPILIINALNVSVLVHRILALFFTAIAVIGLILFEILFSYAKMIKATMLFYEFRNIEYSGSTISKASHRGRFAAGVVGAMALILVVCVPLAVEFDAIFPAETYAYVIAHRCGGVHSNENTVKGIEAAIKRNAAVAETDVQRTADGHYVINHDDSFLRCCGVDKKPSEMTLSEVKKLKVRDNVNPFNPPTEVPTMEEILDAANGRIHLYIELKGKTANPKMVDDVYRMIRERNMQDQTTFISLNYNLVDYAERTYPDVQTGYLCYFSFGDIEDMNCDILLLEAETATQKNIDKIHKAGKEVNVWTINTIPTMMSIFATDADGIITDEISMANTIIGFFKDRSDELRIIQAIF